MKKICIFLLILFAAGCNNPQLYNWERYPNTLYAYKKAPSDENLLKHKEMIVEIITTSKEKELRVPPGIYCEYGFILLKAGQRDEAIKYFELEEKTYPESSVFIQNLKSYLNKPENNIEKSSMDKVQSEIIKEKS